MADKYLELASGELTEKEAITSSAGAGDSGKMVALGGGGKLDSSMMPSGIGADSDSYEASETLSAGDVVNIWDDTTAKARKADASASSTKAMGFVNAGITSGASGTVSYDGVITGLSGLTIGATYYLSETAGQITATPPTTSGAIVQKVGWAKSATELVFEPDQRYVVLA